MLTLENLRVSYGDIAAVKGVSLHVPRGQIFTLIGANGAGKTSTLRAISGLLPYTGRITLDGRDLRGLAPEKIVALGLVQVPEGRGIFGNLTVRENLRLGSWIRRDHKALAQDLDHLLHRLPRLRERLEQPAGTLSGGEQQMLAVARALLAKPSVLLLDEPSMGLAPKLVQEIYQLLREIHAQGVTILLVEQNANLALRLAQQAAVLETGEIRLTGSGSELLVNPEVRRAYLGA